jgi:hypothetical protein
VLQPPSSTPHAAHAPGTASPLLLLLLGRPQQHLKKQEEGPPLKQRHAKQQHCWWVKQQQLLGRWGWQLQLRWHAQQPAQQHCSVHVLLLLPLVSLLLPLLPLLLVLLSHVQE